ncbi:toll/interleukin-1 receptor domain-containing protein [Algoriphagus sp. A40]|uniref:toll/interleukin-1 receptor domain-containing protein n=1 Tax=Algoriphagus sp. A40 TaxID=1945863 RepID=UPI0009875E23|nr:toll/interleukin-1 receptor domain-containing protein [Algoriphagus sp. A40]OOG78260.1 hypothetical protein B0E43_02325 [Algoriphagus sp. A40]
MSSGKIFISYRREDTSGESGRLKDKLEQVFGQANIFYDVETLEAGLNFDQSIAKALNESKVLLAMIGPHWLKVEDNKGVKRLQKPEDWVRKEIAEALKRGLRVIPVLVNGAEMPDQEELPEELKELSLKHAQELTSSRWNYDVGELTKVLEKIITKKPEPKPEPIPRPDPRPFVPPIPKPKSWWAKNYLWAIGGLVGFLILIGMCTSTEDQTYPALDETQDTLAYNSEADIGTQNPEGNEIYNSLQLDNQESEPSQPAVDDPDFGTIPDISGEWNLYLNGEKVSIFAFGQTGIDVAYYEYDGANQRTGEGSGQINGINLSMSYFSSANNVTGTISMATNNSGQTWEGTIYFPASGVSAQVQLARN